MFEADLVHVVFFPVGFEVIGWESFIAKACEFLIEHSALVYFFVFGFHVTGFVGFPHYDVTFFTLDVGIVFGHQSEVYSKLMNKKSLIGKWDKNWIKKGENNKKSLNN
jgi:hypothetical protein